ncbi:MAG: STAS domain-containing protein [Chromatiales bacterium]|nr:MAG: STAS domain-containing protein [Chromatiales bacterium]
MNSPSSAEAGLKADGSGRVIVTGPVTFATAGDLLLASQPLFVGRNAVTVDLGAVTSVDSAGLALLLEWLRRARKAGCSVTYTGLPQKLVAIAKLSGVDAMLVTGPAPAG